MTQAAIGTVTDQEVDRKMMQDLIGQAGATISKTQAAALLAELRISVI